MRHSTGHIRTQPRADGSAQGENRECHGPPLGGKAIDRMADEAAKPPARRSPHQSGSAGIASRSRDMPHSMVKADQDHQAAARILRRLRAVRRATKSGKPQVT